MVEFRKKVMDSDPHLFDKFMNNIDLFQRKGVSLYHEALRKHTKAASSLDKDTVLELVTTLLQQLGEVNDTMSHEAASGNSGGTATAMHMLARALPGAKYNEPASARGAGADAAGDDGVAGDACGSCCVLHVLRKRMPRVDGEVGGPGGRAPGVERPVTKAPRASRTTTRR